MNKVRFQYADVPSVQLKNKTSVKQFVQNLFVLEGKPLHKLNYIFCSDGYLLQINQDFLKHDYYTDIITFDITDDLEQGTIGEVYISIDRVKDNAVSHDTSFTQELLRVIFHGALHLCGYRDKKKSEITMMREKENYYLCLFEKRFS